MSFRLQDLAVWSAAFSLILLAGFQTAPYPAWLREFLEQWWAPLRAGDAIRDYSTTSALIGVLIAWGAIDVTWARNWLGLRFVGWASVVLLTARRFDLSLREIVANYPEQPWLQMSGSEVWIAMIVAALVTASLLLVKLYRELGGYA